MLIQKIIISAIFVLQTCGFVTLIFLAESCTDFSSVVNVKPQGPACPPPKPGD